jgi:AmmeMemoRadiSam system protein B
MNLKNSVRAPSVAGMFYTKNPEKLSSEISQLFEKIHPLALQGNIIALISPHAGYMYSGLTAAYGYKTLEQKNIETAIIVAPSHFEFYENVSVYPGKSYATPLGEVEIAHDLRSLLLKENKNIIADEIGHRKEHAIEVQLPFLQLLFGNRIKILPIVIGNQSRENCFSLGETLAKISKDKSIVLIASSDLSHYYSTEIANELDEKFIDCVKHFDEEKLMMKIENNETEGCGGGCVVAILHAAKLLGATQTRILHHCNSGDVTGQRERVVGYMSAVVTKKNTPKESQI